MVTGGHGKTWLKRYCIICTICTIFGFVLEARKVWEGKEKGRECTIFSLAKVTLELSWRAGEVRAKKKKEIAAKKRRRLHHL